MTTTVQDVFMLFGDSITQGSWETDKNGIGQRLSHVYARKLDVLNRGFSGYTTEWSLPILEKIIARDSTSGAPKIRVLVIWFGANDACIPPSPQHVPLAKFISNLEYMVSFVRDMNSSGGGGGGGSSSSSTRILLLSPPPVCAVHRAADLASRDPPLEPDREFEVTKRYAQAVEDVAREKGVGYVDVWNRVWDAAGRVEENLMRFMWDGLHLNAEGYAIVYDELIQVITREYPDVHYDNLPFVFLP